MKLLSFDVGVKNLAYCLLEYKDNKFIISKWDTIDLLEDPLENLMCIGKKKNNENCNKKASLYHKISNENIGYCKIHGRNINNLKNIIKKKVPNLTHQAMDIKLVNKLDKHKELLDCDIIIIEQQPTKNPRMKSLSMMLHNYFIIRGIVDNIGKLKNVIFVSPRNKLKVYNGPYIECKLKGKYARTKWLGVEYSKWLLREDNNWLNYLVEHKKKDDLADSFLQGLYYLKFKKCLKE